MNPPNRRRRTRAVCGGAALASCLLGLSGCGTTSGSASSVAMVRMIDASSGAGALDIHAGPGALAYNLGFGTVTSYVAMTPANYALSVNMAGTKSALSTVHAGLASGKQYTLLMTTGGSSVNSQLLTDQSVPSAAGTVSLRLVDEAAYAGSLDVYLVPSGATLAGTTALQRGLAHGVNTGYLNVPAGIYTLYAVSAGTVLSTTTVALFSGPATSYPAGSARTILLLDAQLQTSPPITATTLADYDPAGAAQ